MGLDTAKARNLTSGVLRIGLGAILLWTGLQKISQPHDFVSAVYDYGLVGPKAGILVAVVLPWLEVFVGISLIIGLFTGGALLTACVLGVLFTFVQASALWRGLSIDCGCSWGQGPSLIGYKTLFASLLFLLAASVAFAFNFLKFDRPVH